MRLPRELRALAGGTPFNHAPSNALTDGVGADDKPFLTTFPYVPSPSVGVPERRAALFPAAPAADDGFRGAPKLARS